MPVLVSVSKEERIHASANQIFDMIQMPRDQFDQECFSESSISQETRKSNETQGKGMKVYQFRRYLLKPETPIYNEILRQADECTSRVQEALKQRGDHLTQGALGDRLVALE